MVNNDNNIESDFICGTIVPKEIYEKAKTKCEKANTTINELIKVFIYQFTNGEIRIAKRQELTQQHEDKGESNEND